VRSKYREVAGRPTGHFPYPVGRAGAERLGYACNEIDAVPADVVARFVGVGNPFSIRRPAAGERVLDVGCGAGFDTYVAARSVGPAGRAVGIDLSPEMLAVARRAAAGRAPDSGAVEFVEGTATALPWPDASFDQVIPNGALNLVHDKAAAVHEIARVLVDGGTFAWADLLVVEDVPREVLEDPAAWAT
jgi:ubiquinone/menaquinone biosynthesis C-methylase UbiE